MRPPGSAPAGAVCRDFSILTDLLGGIRRWSRCAAAAVAAAWAMRWSGAEKLANFVEWFDFYCWRYRWGMGTNHIVDIKRYDS